jgi:hypothetical protein
MRDLSSWSRRRALAAAVAAAIAAIGSACGHSTTPTPARAVLTVTLTDITSAVDTAPTVGITYGMRIHVAESAGVAATVTSITVTLRTTTLALSLVPTLNPFGGSSSQFVPSQVPAGGSATSALLFLDDHDTAHPVWTSVHLDLLYSDAVGSQTASATNDLPALPRAVVLPRAR